jgi:hypothetical protein
MVNKQQLRTHFVHDVGIGFQAEDHCIEQNKKNQKILNPWVFHEIFNSIFPRTARVVDVIHWTASYYSKDADFSA